MPFPRVVGSGPAPAVEGDFSDSNPRFVVNAGPGGLVAGTNCFAGRFGWATPPNDPDGSPTILNSNGSGPVTGFIRREQTGILTVYLQEASMQLMPGYDVTAFSGGGFWVRNSGSGEVTLGMKAYANFADGRVTFAATASPTTGATSTASTIGAGTASVTASITGNLLTCTVVGSGVLVPGGLLSGTNVATGTRIVSQVSSAETNSALGLTGTYIVSIPDQTVASTTVSETYGTLTVGGTLTGAFGVGDPITGGGTSAGTIITALGTGTGGAGTYIVNNTQTVGSGALAATANVETKWVAMSQGAPNDLIKISDHVLG